MDGERGGEMREKYKKKGNKESKDILLRKMNPSVFISRIRGLPV